MDAMATQESSDANPASSSIASPRTLANNGQWYSFNQFLTWYGAIQAQSKWDAARTEKARCGVLARDGQIYPEDKFRDVESLVSHGSAAKPVPTETASCSAAEPVPSASATCSAGANHAGAPLLFTVDDLEGMSACLGGKKAWQCQRSLREVRTKSNTPHAIVNLSHSDFDWKAMLKSLPTAPHIIGCGVTAFNFRLLPDVMDQNYIKIDSGERHVFEVVRADASRVLLHFHKNGKCDPPEILPAKEVAPSDAATSEQLGVTYTCQPALEYSDIMGTAAAGDKSAPLGRAEATIALQSLLISGFGEAGIGAINLTDGVAFPWTRFLKNNVMCKEYVGPGINRVYVARFHRDDELVLLLCRADGGYVELRPAAKSNRHTFHNKEGDAWQQIKTLQNAKYIGMSWMQIRQGITL